MKTRFSQEEADSALNFFPRHLAHTKGRFAGQPFMLEPFQASEISYVFGTQVWDDELKMWVRMVRTVYEEVPRKQGKSTKGAGIALKGAAADGEVGAEVYSVAEDLDQANIIFAMARRMVENSPTLSSICINPRTKKPTIYKRLIEFPKTGNVYRVIPGDASGAHGLNPHFIVFDELHTQSNRELWDVMTSGQGTRTQPLLWAFTTAGTDRESICWEQHDYGEQVKAGIRDDPTFHYIRYGIEDGEDWQNEEVWKKCNPALGKFLSLNFLKSEYVKAKASPARQNAFRNLYLNEWTQQVERWLDMDVWDGSGAAGMGANEFDLKYKTCYGGLHLGPVGGMSAWVLTFPDPEDIETIRVLPRFFCPEREVNENRQYGPLFQQWRDQDLLMVTPGDVTDYAAIRQQIVEDAEHFDLQSINVRQIFKGAEISSWLVDMFGEDRVRFFNPSFPGFAASTHELERALGANKLWHSGHPILRWMADNAAARTNENGDVKPDQDRSQGSIVGIVALCMALDLAIEHREDSGDPMVGMISF